jgi:hypothetical protein
MSLSTPLSGYFIITTATVSHVIITTLFEDVVLLITLSLIVIFSSFIARIPTTPVEISGCRLCLFWATALPCGALPGHHCDRIDQIYPQRAEPRLSA